MLASTSFSDPFYHIYIDSRHLEWDGGIHQITRYPGIPPFLLDTIIYHLLGNNAIAMQPANTLVDVISCILVVATTS